jgi:CheY-like chemotaxis protein
MSGAGAVSSPTAPGRVLIVEDDDGVSESLRDALLDEGYDAVVARNGQEALDWLAAHPRPQLILLDLWMPVLTGEEFRLRQLADPALADIPVIIISAAPDARARGRALQAAAVLAKPVNLHKLLAMVAQHRTP